MKINKKTYPVVDWLERRISWSNLPINREVVDYQVSPGFRRFHGMAWKDFLDLAEGRRFSVDYVTEPVRELVDGDLRVGEKLWRERNLLVEASGVFLLREGLSYCYYFTRQGERVFFYTLTLVRDVLMGADIGYWSLEIWPDLFLHETSFDLVADVEPNFRRGFHTQMAAQLAVFLLVAELEVRRIASGRSGTPRKAALGEVSFLNEFRTPVRILDSGYYTRIVREEGFPVRGHFRLQPCGRGRRERRLVWVRAFEKSGYSRRARIEQ